MKKSTLLLVSIGFGILTGGLLALAFPSGAWLRSWLAYGAVCVPACAALALAWRELGAGRGLAWMLLLAFGLRVATGALLQAVLPLHGNGSEPELHGYLFYDAYARDQAAWTLAQSGQPLATAFGGKFADDDQYGGLLALSALVYRALSPDAVRPLLTVLLGAVFTRWACPSWLQRSACAGGRLPRPRLDGFTPSIRSRCCWVRRRCASRFSWARWRWPPGRSSGCLQRNG